MKINEIFLSIQGEGLITGYPTIFIRFTGCNLRCNYCDTTYSYYEGKDMKLEDLIEEINSYEFKRACITGGEPLLNEEIQTLLDALKGYRVVIETNGSIPLNRVKLYPCQTFVMDIKTPSSGQQDKMCFSNISRLRREDEIKFVIGDREDYEWSKQIMKKYEINNIVTFSPVFGKIDAEIIAGWILEDRLDVRLGLQLHKIIFDGERRGVWFE